VPATIDARSELTRAAARTRPVEDLSFVRGAPGAEPRLDLGVGAMAEDPEGLEPAREPGGRGIAVRQEGQRRQVVLVEPLEGARHQLERHRPSRHPGAGDPVTQDRRARQRERTAAGLAERREPADAQMVGGRRGGVGDRDQPERLRCRLSVPGSVERDQANAELGAGRVGEGRLEPARGRPVEVHERTPVRVTRLSDRPGPAAELDPALRHPVAPWLASLMAASIRE
jgi:hypothetical protein